MTYLLGESLRALSGATRLTRTSTRARSSSGSSGGGGGGSWDAGARVLRVEENTALPNRQHGQGCEFELGCYVAARRFC